MAEESLIEGKDENILYDLLVITEWPTETDTQVSLTDLGFIVCLFRAFIFARHYWKVTQMSC